MPVRTFSTDEKCPNCKVNIYDSLHSHVFENGGRDFEFECPSCGRVLEITVEPVPAFKITEPKEEVEFPVYYDSQGREHAEF